MFRRPERIELAVAGITVALLLYVGLLPLIEPGLAVDRIAVLAGASLTAFSVVAGSFLARPSHRTVLLLLHLAAFLFLVLAFGGSSRSVEMLLLFLLELDVSVRLPLAVALPVNAAVLGLTTLVGLSFGSPLADRVEVLSLGALVVFFAELGIYYRERLVRASNTIDFQARSLENLAAANHSFVAHLESAKEASAEQERLMITRELHDAIGYSLTNIAMMMNAAPYLKDENPEKLVHYCQKAKEIASTTLQETRQILYKLRTVAAQVTRNPPLFFTRLCQDFAQATGVRTDCHIGNLPAAVNEQVLTTLFRSVQVGFINALRHGSTAHISLAFWVTDTDLQMRIWNDAPMRLSDPAVVGEGIGLRGVRERLEAVNGTLSYGPVADGFEMTVTIPREETGIAIY